MTTAQIPLWRKLNAAAVVVLGVRGGRTSAFCLNAVDAELRPAAQALAFEVLRRLGTAQALRLCVAPRAPPPAADALLCCALALLWQQHDAPYDPFVLVDQSVEAAKRSPATRPQAAFINACLRRFLREREALAARVDADPVARWNHPLWWIDAMRDQYPEHWQRILAANNQRPPLTLRINRRRTSQVAYLALLAEQGIGATPVGPFGVVLDRPQPVQRIPGFADGLVSVQDGAAQLAAPLLLADFIERDSSQPPLRVLDACAAPGGKTAHLLELADCDLTAIDLDPPRCELISDNLRRLGLAATVLVVDAARPGDWWHADKAGHALFDAILLDAPCTASGIVRRHPDVRWLRRETDVDQLARTQKTLLEALWPLLRGGGRLLYSTCSVFRAEGNGQIKTFLAHHIDAVLRPSPGHLLPGDAAGPASVPDNANGGNDGFFYALLEKRPT